MRPWFSKPADEFDGGPWPSDRQGNVSYPDLDGLSELFGALNDRLR